MEYCTNSEGLEVVHTDPVAEKVKQDILEHTGVTVPAQQKLVSILSILGCSIQLLQ